MAAVVANIAKGRVNEFVRRVDGNDPANSALIVVLLKVAETNAVLQDYDDMSALLGAAGNTECDLTNYTRKTLTATDLSAPNVDDTNDRQESSIPDLVYTSAGGATNNSIVKAVICYDADTTAGTDANIIPLTIHDLTVTTDGTDLTISDPATGFYRAA